MSTRSKCKLNADGSVCLQAILDSFNSPIREEHAWALCYQCAKFYLEVFAPGVNRSTCYLVLDVGEVFLKTDGNVHPATLFGCGIEEQDHKRRRLQNENYVDLVNGLGLVIYNALEQGNNDDEERAFGPDLEELINHMIADDRNHGLHETDDEGIEKDSDETFDESSATNSKTLLQILAKCEQHLLTLTKSQAEIHYRAVVRALVAEGLELATFLEKVAQGGPQIGQDLEQLRFEDWARYWVQVIAELRLGVKLKKVHHTRAPIEYELTPYEILMKDIRTCRYNLRKTALPRKTKDAHAIILDFIRSRPPLKKASDRKLAPYTRKLTPREQLMSSIRKGRPLRQTGRCSLSPRTEVGGQTTTKRLIKVDFSQIRDVDEEEDDDDDEESDGSESALGLWAQEESLQCGGAALEAYDLALDSPHGLRRNMLMVIDKGDKDKHGAGQSCRSVPQSRPCSRQSCSSDTEPLPPDIARALERNKDKPWHESMPLDDLTLEEIVHIRTVLTQAELEALPVEGRVKSDAENRKVCFLCLKTRFGILGPWGSRCAICKRTVCAKCCSKMHVPMEHFAGVPVVLLSPSILATPVEDNFPISKFAQAGSSQSSPSKSPSAESARRFQQQRAKPASVVDRLKGAQMIVCQDCRMMVLQIIKSAQTNRAAMRNKTIQNLTLNLSPVFQEQL